MVLIWWSVCCVLRPVQNGWLYSFGWLINVGEWQLLHDSYDNDKTPELLEMARDLSTTLILNEVISQVDQNT